MKKLVLLLAVAFSVSMFSCGKGEKAAAVDSDSVKAAAQTEVVEQAPVDTPAVVADSTVAPE
jgi:hypothetical protein